MKLGYQIIEGFKRKGIKEPQFMKMFSLSREDAEWAFKYDSVCCLTKDQLIQAAEATDVDLNYDIFKYANIFDSGTAHWDNAYRRWEASLKPCTVYGLRCESNGRMWVGVSSDRQGRVKNHFYCLRKGNHTCKELQSDFDKFGEKAFKVYALEENVHYDDRLNREQHFMEIYKTRDPEFGYNAKHPKPKVSVTFIDRLPPLPDAV